MYNLTYKSIDVMKKSKDTLTSQLTTAEKTALVATLATTGCTHIAISVPMDDNSKWTGAGVTPSPRTAEAEVMDWCDVIHAQTGLDGNPLKVIHRGSFAGVEGPGNMYGLPFETGVSMGTSASAASDGNSTWCGRYYNYLYNHVGTHVLTGDIFAPIPEGSINAFGGNFFTNQSNYLAFFPNLHTITTAYGVAKGVTPVFMTHDQFSQAASGWISSGLFSDQNLVGLDYYGHRKTDNKLGSDFVYDWQQMYLGKDCNGGGNNGAGGLNQFQGEYGDIPNDAMPAWASANIESHLHYLIQFYKAYRDGLITPNGHMIGFNYWGGWEGQNTSILNKSGSGSSSVYTLNAMGKVLAAFFRNQGGMVRIPVTTSGTPDGIGQRTYAY